MLPGALGGPKRSPADQEYLDSWTARQLMDSRDHPHTLNTSNSTLDASMTRSSTIPDLVHVKMEALTPSVPTGLAVSVKAEPSTISLPPSSEIKMHAVKENGRDICASFYLLVRMFGDSLFRFLIGFNSNSLSGGVESPFVFVQDVRRLTNLFATGFNFNSFTGFNSNLLSGGVEGCLEANRLILQQVSTSTGVALKALTQVLLFSNKMFYSATQNSSLTSFIFNSLTNSNDGANCGTSFFEHDVPISNVASMFDLASLSTHSFRVLIPATPAADKSQNFMDLFGIPDEHADLVVAIPASSRQHRSTLCPGPYCLHPHQPWPLPPLSNR
ncbi:hypothetical protein DFH07DRAFT_780655 [Mycena maculata]|uniref:Uncharacterized protein n=1 Tax=Mycena maculata TaxID=230809 RepID=A0AAD7MV13_9AGAR|nr:hypothetical protein DFH07DRAFT_780655 [Mycena maculata]